jgi:hypothetical protein
LEIHADRERQLRYLDPDGRQLYLSCGAVSEFARLAIRSLGRSCTVRLLPAGGKDTKVATLTVGSPEPVTSSEQRLIDAVARRYTDRGPYTDQQVPAAVLRQIREAVSDRHCWLRLITQSKDRLSVIRLLSQAESAEAADAGYREELGQWRREGPSPDGVPLGTFASWEASRVSDVPLRDYFGGDSHPHPGRGTPPKVERDTLVLLGTDQDDPTSWLRAGRGLAELLLAITDAGLVSQPLGPVLDVPYFRGCLRQELGLVGHPQLLMRVGHGMRRPMTGRRAIGEVFAATSAV